LQKSFYHDLSALFEKKAINHIIVVPDSQAIYYSKDGMGAYICESETKSEKMTIFYRPAKRKNNK